MAMILKVGQGTAHVVGSVVDGVTGRNASPRRNSSCCELRLLRNGVEVEPLARQCSGQTFEQGAFSEPKVGSKAAFFYYAPSVFDRSDGHVPRIDLVLHDPSKSDQPARVELDPKTVETLAADLDLTPATTDVT